VGDVVPGILADLGLADAARVARLAESWPAVVGEAMAAWSRPVALRDGVLEVEVTTSTGSQQLRLRRDEILAGLRPLLGEHAPEDLHLRIGRLDAPGAGGGSGAG
jgi:predicted nucleic acid-binding Zn ribbon protein